MRSVKDYMTLLEPEHGLAIKHVFGIVETDPAIYGLVIDIGQRLGGDECGVDDRAGAWDVTALGAMRRGIGEAVERYVLRPPATEKREQDSYPQIREAARLPQPVENANWMPANRARKSEMGKFSTDTVLVDADWINLPTSEQSRRRNWFGTPSGAASHTSLAGALDASIRELIERDDVTRAWNQLTRAEKIETVSGNCVSVRKVNKLLSSPPIHLYRIKSQVGGFYTYMAWCVEAESAAAGSSLSACPACAALHAVIECKQVSALLREVKTSTESKNLKNPVEVANSTEVSNFADLSANRLQFWNSLAGIEAWSAWDEAARKSATIRVNEHVDEKFTSQDVANAGFTHIWVDLSSRLPEKVAKAGFHAVKSIIPELLALPMSEGESWNTVADGKPFSSWEPLL